jgi:hypothetical protein
VSTVFSELVGCVLLCSLCEIHFVFSFLFIVKRSRAQ